MKWIMIVIACAACGEVEQGTDVIAEPDVAIYASDVHPYLEASCATLDCHGQAGHPLRLFAETGLRLEGVSRDALVTDEELALDARSIFGVDPGAAPDASIVVLKPLDERAGGMGHTAPTIFRTREDDGYVCLVRFLAGGPFDEAFHAACGRAYDAVALPPREE